MKSKHQNRLIFEKSPYLLQHAHNPVDWYPWGPEAFERAHKEDKPVFLSIGYSTCHWCHVMEREAFEDPETARIMNDTFVSIKVDREERPDIDSIYMTVCQMLTGSGGWPLTIIMTPDKKPFFAGTYIPKESRLGRIGMMELVPRIKEIWRTKRDEVLRSANQIAATLQQESRGTEGEGLDESVLRVAFEELAMRFDGYHGGFGRSPKFPTPHNLFFLLRHWRRTGDAKALEMVEKTLQAMRHGGIYDHIGFGFHRYSTDPEWLVPHFEKMLYDQAMLAMAYIEAYQATRRMEYRKTAREVFTYVLRDMTAPRGGFYSAEDADSEGEEGKFYLWREEEVRQVLPGEEADLFVKVFNIEKDGNFAEQPGGSKNGLNIPHTGKPLAEIASELGIPERDLNKRLERARLKLFAYREGRIHPEKDDKILADWNGLMIAAFAKGAQVFADPTYARAAKRAVDFVLNNMCSSDWRLIHRYRDGQAAIPAYLDDYAFLIWGLLELYEATFETTYLQSALNLNKVLLDHFWDGEHGGFYITADDSEAMLLRRKEIYDGAMPSGNSVAMMNLLRLGHVTASSDFLDRAAVMGRAFSEAVRQMPSAYTQLMVAVDFLVGPSYEVVIAGDSQGKDTKSMMRALRSEFIPNKIVLLRPTEHESPDVTRLAEFTKYQSSIDGRATAYVCFNYACNLPTTSISEMLRLLNAKEQ